MTPSPDRIRRFTRAERWIHLTFAALLGVCIVTAAMLYWGPLSTLVGRRDLVETVHYAAGLMVPPVPEKSGMTGRQYTISCSLRS